MNLEEYQKIDEMDTKLWNIGFYREFACDFEYDGWQEFDDNVLHGLDEPNIRILHSLDVVREFPNLLPENLLFFAFGGSAEDFMEKMLRNSSACGFSGTFITYDMIRQRFCHQHVDNGELDTGWVWLEQEWFPDDFPEDNEDFLDYLYNYQSMTDELEDMNEDDAIKEFKNITDKYHFYEKFGVNDNNHYFSEKLTNDLPYEFTIENENYKVHSQIKERLIFLRQNGLEKFDEWIEGQGI